MNSTNTINKEEFIKLSRKSMPRLLEIYKGKINGRDNYYFGKEVICLISNSDVLDIVGVNPLFKIKRKETDRAVSCYVIENGKVNLEEGAFSCTTDEKDLKIDLAGEVNIDFTKNLLRGY